MIRTAERMGGAVYTEDLVAKQVNTICLSLYIYIVYKLKRLFLPSMDVYQMLHNGGQTGKKREDL